MTVPHALLSEIGGSSVDARLDAVEAKVATVAAPTGNATTDRTAIQTALNAPGISRAKLHPNAVYTVNWAGGASTPSHGVTPYDYCLIIPSGVTLDLNGSTIKLAPGVTASVVRGPSAGGSNIGLVGFGTIDGSGNSATVTTNGFAVYFDGITGLDLDVKVINTSLGAVCFEACSKIRAPRIVVDTCNGFGVGVGNGLAPVADSWFGLIDVRGITEWAPNVANFPGNTLVGVMQRCRFDTVICRNSGANIKVDSGSVDTSFGFVYGESCGAGTAPTNSGLKFQGSGAGTPLRCHAATVHMKGQGGQGLFMEQCVDCSVGTYIGDANNTVGTTADVWIAGLRDTIGHVRISGSNGASLLLRSNAVDYRIGIVEVRDPAIAYNGVSDSGASGAIGHLLVVDSTGRIDRGYRSNSANSSVRFEQIEIRNYTVTPLQRTVGDKVSVAGTFRVTALVDLDAAVVNTDAAYTVTPGQSAVRQFHTGTLTADRLVTLALPPGSLYGWPSGVRFRFTRTGAGAFNLNIGGLKNLATNQWCEVEPDPAAVAWKLVAFGSL